MATDILDLFPHQDVLDYTKTVETPNLLGAALFPARKVQSNDIKVLTSGTNVPGYRFTFTLSIRKLRLVTVLHKYQRLNHSSSRRR